MALPNPVSIKLPAKVREHHKYNDMCVSMSIMYIESQLLAGNTTLWPFLLSQQSFIVLKNI